jgi:hypothetical protein
MPLIIYIARLLHGRSRPYLNMICSIPHFQIVIFFKTLLNGSVFAILFNNALFVSLKLVRFGWLPTSGGTRPYLNRICSIASYLGVLELQGDV